MNLINKERGTGKTTSLIYTSEVTKYPIVVDNSNAVKFIKEKARELGCKIPNPITVDELKNSS